MNSPDASSINVLAVEPCLRDARAGSTEALGRVLELCRQYLLAIANQELESQLQAKTGASDLVQDTFLEAQRIFARFQGNTVDALLAWLRAILLNKLSECNRHYAATEKRQVAREQSLDGDPDVGRRAEGCLADAMPAPSSLVLQAEQREAVLRALDRLPEHYRQVIRWRQWEDLPFAEIARRLDRSVDAVRMLWWRALEQLQQEMETSP